MAEADKFEFESFQDPQTIKDYLLSVVEGIKNGRIVLVTDNQEIVLRPAGLLKVSVKAKRKDNQSRFSIRVAWKDMPRDEVSAGRTISIGS
jgi:amphi-Trp domain-containing protein